MADVALVGSASGPSLTVRECRRSSCIDPGSERARGPTGCLSSHGRVARGELPPTLVQRAHTDDRGVELFVVSSRAWLLRQRASDDRARARTRDALDRLARRVACGELRDPHHIGKLAARITARDEAYPHFDWRHTERSFLYLERPGPSGPRAAQGTYVVRTTARAPGRSSRSAGRPGDGSVSPPAFVTALAFMVERVLRSRKRPALALRALAAEALDALEPMSIVDLGAPGR
jgi:hypothetical protein